MIDSSNDSMKISPPAARASTSTKNTTTSTSMQTESPQSGVAGTQGDSVELTSSAQQLSKINRAMAAADGINQDKIDRIKQAIAEGNYPIDAKKVAQSMSSLEGMLSNTSKNP